MIPSSSVWAAWIPVVLVVAVISVRRRRSFSATIAALLLTTYVFGLLSMTLFPLPVDSALIAMERSAKYLSSNFEPLRTIRDAFTPSVRLGALYQLAGNLVLLMPLTFLVAVLWRRMRTWKIMLALGFGIAVFIELLQMAISGVLGYTYKITDVDDVLLNVVGAAIGYAIFCLAVGLVNRRRKVSHDLGQARQKQRTTPDRA